MNRKKQAHKINKKQKGACEGDRRKEEVEQMFSF